MHGSIVPSAPRHYVPSRRLVLGTAFILALVVWLAPETPTAAAQESPPAAPAATVAPSPAAGGEGPGIAINIGIKADPEPAKDDRAKESAGASVKDETDPATGKRTLTVIKNGKTVTVTGAPGDREFDSFGEIVHTEPALAIMIITVVAVVFLSPVLAIALILGYRMRKARMQNETMLKLAEKGVVAPAEAMAAVAAGTTPAQVGSDGAARAAAGAAGTVEYAKQLRKRAAWSDLRKGVVMAAIGLGLTLYSVFHDRSPNGIGLVLLFVGIGYVVLWWFEDRQIAPPSGGSGTPPGAGPGGSF